jgi:group II intron reverse transcriptase/maturase
MLVLSERTNRALAGISKATMQKGVRIKHLFRIMTHSPDLWMSAYARISKNRGAVTEGATQNTLDGMSAERINNLIALLKDGRYEPTPVRRVYIPKANGKRRPLGIPTGDDKLVQEVVRQLLELVYEPIFPNSSHGFRPKRSCHTALIEVRDTWLGTKWIVDMDISGFYDNIDHKKLIDILAKKIDDKRFIALIGKLLHAGYLEDWKFHGTYSGTPQDGICSPILANIFLGELDRFVENQCDEFNKGARRNGNPAYNQITAKIRRLRDELHFAKKHGGFLPGFESETKEVLTRLESERRRIPCLDSNDEGYKRLRYIRYADDFALGVTGTKEEAEQIKAIVTQFLKEKLGLDVAEEKSGIRHMSEGFNFLGYYVCGQRGTQRTVKARCGYRNDGSSFYGVKRTLTATIGLEAPKEKIWEFCRRQGYLNGSTPQRRPYLLQLDDLDIVKTYNAEMRGFANYYALAPATRLGIMEWAGVQSLFHTLAAKHKTTFKAMRAKLKAGDEHILRSTVDGKTRLLKVFKVKHRMGKPRYGDLDRRPSSIAFATRPSEIITRLERNSCEYCGRKGGYFEVHHIRRLKDVRKSKQQDWEKLMCAIRRKTLVLCYECHNQLHHGGLPSWKRDANARMESAVH